MSDTANTMSEETHRALLTQAVAEATSATDSALAAMTAERDTMKTELASVIEERDSLKSDNARLNGDLDKAQIDLKTASDKASELETELASERNDRAKADTASKRAEQVKNLGLFGDDYVTEKASAWAEIDEAAWAERVDEWTKLHKPEVSAGTADTASAMSGSTEKLTAGGDTDAASANPPSARRGVLGLA